MSRPSPVGTRNVDDDTPRAGAGRRRRANEEKEMIDLLRTLGRMLRLLLPVTLLLAAGCEKGEQAEDPVAAVPVETLSLIHI